MKCDETGVRSLCVGRGELEVALAEIHLHAKP